MIIGLMGLSELPVYGYNSRLIECLIKETNRKGKQRRKKVHTQQKRKNETKKKRRGGRESFMQHIKADCHISLKTQGGKEDLGRSF